MNFQQIIAAVRNFWGRQSVMRRVLFMVLFLLIVVIGATSSGLVMGGGRIPLYSDIPPEETAGMTAKLKTAGIEYRLENGGTRITVAENDFAKARVLIASDSPTRNKGMEIFDESPLAVPPFVWNVNYVRALQGELARSIGAVQGVQSVRVHIARPEPTPFIRDQKPVTAGVALVLKSGAGLSRQQAQGIVALVSRSVEGLKPENVSIVDQSGRLLSDPNSGEEEAVPKHQLDYKRDLEKYLAQKAESLLAAHLGPGRAAVRVSADVDFKRLRERSRQFLQPGVPVHEKTSTSKSTGGSGARGPAGATSNVTRAGGSTSSASGGSANDESAVTDYALSSTERDIEDRMASVSRLTIAAMIDLSAPADGEGTKPSITVTDAQDIIKQAVGFKTARGDEIKVTDAKLSAGVTVPEEKSTSDLLSRSTAIITLVRNGALALTALTILGMLSLLLLRRPRRPPVAATDGTTGGTTGGGPSAPLTPEEMERQAEERRRKELEQFVELARRDPDMVAGMILNMLGGSAK